MDLRELRGKMKQRSDIYMAITNSLGDIDAFLKLLAQQDKDSISKENWDFAEEAALGIVKILKEERKTVKIPNPIENTTN